MLRRLLLGSGAAVFVLALSTATAFAANPSGIGQPGASCGSPNATVMPKGFSSGGFANAETHYANPDSTGGTHSSNVRVVAQYDVACYQLTLHH